MSYASYVQIMFSHHILNLRSISDNIKNKGNPEHIMFSSTAGLLVETAITAVYNHF